MEYLLVFILAVLVAMGQGYAAPKFAASKIGSHFQSNYPLRTLGSGLVIFVAIILATVVIQFATKEAVRLPNPA